MTRYETKQYMSKITTLRFHFPYYKRCYQTSSSKISDRKERNGKERCRSIELLSLNSIKFCMVSLKIIVNVSTVSAIIFSGKNVLDTKGQDDCRISFLATEKKENDIDQMKHISQLAIRLSL